MLPQSLSIDPSCCCYLELPLQLRRGALRLLPTRGAAAASVYGKARRSACTQRHRIGYVVTFDPAPPRHPARLLRLPQWPSRPARSQLLLEQWPPSRQSSPACAALPLSATAALAAAGPRLRYGAAAAAPPAATLALHIPLTASAVIGCWRRSCWGSRGSSRTLISASHLLLAEPAASHDAAPVRLPPPQPGPPVRL